MSSLTSSRKTDSPPNRLFTLLAGEFEGGTVPAGSGGGARSAPQDRMGVGLRFRCPGKQWSLPEDSELEVVDYLEPHGWRAVSRSGSPLTMEIGIRPSQEGSVLTLLMDHRPRGLRARVWEIVLCRRRRIAVEGLLEEWQRNAERQEGLRRLRAAAGNRLPDAQKKRP
jgi:hypothetical protein